MAYRCVKGLGECIGRGYCEPKPIKYDIYSTPIYEGDEYYEIEGEIVHEENLLDYLRPLKVVAK